MTPATRRRGSALEQAIYAAVMDQLEAVGYAKLSMEGVATAAHTGKAALYRRWSGKDELIRDTLVHVLPSPAEVPRHDSVRADLLALLTCWADMVDISHGTLLEVLKMDEGGAKELLKTTVRETVVRPLRALIVDALRRGAERGEVRPEAATELMSRVGPAMVTSYCLDRGYASLTPQYLEQVIDEVVLPLVTVRR